MARNPLGRSSNFAAAQGRVRKFADAEEAFKAARRAILNNALRRRQKSLDLSNYGLAELPSEIGQLDALESLNLAHNDLTALPQEIGSLTNLKTLFISYNRITALPDEIGLLSSLANFDLSVNSLQHIPSGIGLCRKLETLDATDNAIESIPISLFEVRTIKSINFTDNVLSYIPQDIKCLSLLSRLFLGDNNLDFIPEEVGSLINLKLLSVNGNSLSKLPPSIGRLKNLVRLMASDNQISSVPDEFKGLESIRTLDLSGNEISSLPEIIETLSNLNTLLLAGNRLRSFDIDFGKLLELRNLDLSENQFSQVPSGLFNARRMVDLNLSSNELREISRNVGQFSSLRSLNLDNNRLTKLPPNIGSLMYLRYLDVDNNRLDSLPSEAASLTRLQRLSVKNNKIRGLPSEIGNLRSLASAAESDSEPFTEGLFIDGNPLIAPYPSLINKGQPSATRNVLSWLMGDLESDSLSDVVEDQDGDIRSLGGTAPPSIPSQGAGPQFDVDEQGVLNFLHPGLLNEAGNNISRLSSLHPHLIDLAITLENQLGKGNIPHFNLRERLEDYITVLDARLNDIDFSRLYVEGVRLANAAGAASALIMQKELPALDATAEECLNSLLHLHGTFILATNDGMLLLADEERYQRNQIQENRYRAAAIEFAEKLSNKPGLVDPQAATFILGAAGEIGRGMNAERSGVVATAVLRNVAVALSAAATLGAVSAIFGSAGSAVAATGIGIAASAVLSEGMKKSKPFLAMSGLVTKGIDKASEAEIGELLRDLGEKLRPQFELMEDAEQELRRLAAENDRMDWLTRTLDWMRMIKSRF